MLKEIEHYKITIRDNETIAERDRSYIDYKGILRYATTTCKSNNTEGDIYDKKIGTIVSILKTLGFSRRIIGKISDILLEENERK